MPNGFLVISNVLASAPDITEADIAQVRRFDRLYERHINELQARALINEFSWAEMLVLHELGVVTGGRSAAWLIGRLDFNAGYLCRILKRLCLLQLAACSPSHEDGRLREYELTGNGRELVRSLEEFHRREALRMIDLLPQQERSRLLDAMRTIEEVFRRHPLADFSEPWSSPLRKRARYRLRR